MPPNFYRCPCHLDPLEYTTSKQLKSSDESRRNDTCQIFFTSKTSWVATEYRTKKEHNQWFCFLVVILLSPQLVLDDQAIGGREIGNSSMEGAPDVEVGGVVVREEGRIPLAIELCDKALTATRLSFVRSAYNWPSLPTISTTFNIPEFSTNLCKTPVPHEARSGGKQPASDAMKGTSSFPLENHLNQ